ncbi:MAG TPA: amidase [Candidatus Binataceae bacterium]|nr:amidase [Candidatus Binataceae bacterium]
MPLRLPTADDLHRLAAVGHFSLSREELTDFQALMPAMFETLDALDRMPLAEQPLKYPDRDPGSRPEPKSDPFNAIIRRCSVKGANSGKLAGRRVGIKDNISVAGIPMTCGSSVMEGHVPTADATLVSRILDAGGHIVAKLNLDNFAFAGAGDTSSFGPTRNPHNLDFLAGGSSGGSGAALYYDDFDLTIGGDQGGSIRIPSSWCGVVGLKPTHSLVPYTGCIGIDPTFDHAGPMARSVADVALLLEVIAGQDPDDPRQHGGVKVQPYADALGKDLKGARIAMVREGFGGPVAEPDVDATVQRALATMRKRGAQVEEVSIPMHLEGDRVAWGLMAEGAAALFSAHGVGYHFKGSYDAGFADSFGRYRKERGDDLPPTVKLVSLVGSYLNSHYHGRLYDKAQHLRATLRAAYDAVLANFDAIAMPTTPMKAHRYRPHLRPGELISHGWNMLGNTAPFDMTGHPSISVPCGKSDGLPVGLMLTGKHFDEMALLRIADAFERSGNWKE